MQTDPIGYVAGLNLYTYCGNNPINWVDSWGLWPKRIHDDLIDKGFPELPKKFRDAMKRGSHRVDTESFSDSYKHAMGDLGQSVEDVRGK